MAVGAGLAIGHDGALGGVTIVELCRIEWASLEKFRLEALNDAPHAFVTTVDVELGRPPEYWEALIDRATWVLVWDKGQMVGLASLARPDVASPPSCRFVESVWVEPGHRGRGLLRTIMRDFEGRAVADGATELRLWVLDSNEPAARAYRRLGFCSVPGGVQDTIKRGPGRTFVKERLMSRRLS